MGSIGARTLSTPNILCASDRLQVGRITASSILAEVVYLKTIGDGAHQELVGDTVDEFQLSIDTDLRIPVVDLGTLPDPAPVDNDHTRHQAFQ